MSRRLGILISGRGSNLQSIIDAIQRGELQATIAVVISNRPEAAGLLRAKEAGLETVCLRQKDFDSRDGYDTAVADALCERAVDLVCLAGFMRLVGAPLLDAFPHRILNIHPSLLPAFGGRGMYGHHVHEAVFATGVKISGCTVHFVDDTYDTGPIILQRAIDISHCQTTTEIAAEVFKQECQVYPDAIRLIASGKWRVEGKRVL